MIGNCILTSVLFLILDNIHVDFPSFHLYTGNRSPDESIMNLIYYFLTITCVASAQKNPLNA